MQETIVQSYLSDRITEMKESETIKMASLARELKSEGHDVISLSLGEPDFTTPEHIKDAAKKALDDNFTYYTPVPGFLELRKAISNKFKRDNGLDYSPEQIVVSTGAKQSIANVALCLVDPGDEVLLPAPYWVSYAAIAQVAEAKIVEVTTDIENDFKVTAQQLEQKITAKTKLIIFSSPCNPTGSVYSKEELRSIAEVVARHKHVHVISDEIYEYINFSGTHESLAQFDFIKEQVITVNGFSKGFAMTGWRVGYIGAPVWLAKACGKMQGQFTSGTCSIAQKAAEVAISSHLDETYKMRDAFLARRNLVIDLLRDIPGVKTNVPEGAFYVFPDISAFFGKSDGTDTISDPSDLAMYLLKDAKVALVTGKAFGDPNGIRISYAASEKLLREALDRIKKSLSKLH